MAARVSCRSHLQALADERRPGRRGAVVVVVVVAICCEKSWPENVTKFSNFLASLAASW